MRDLGPILIVIGNCCLIPLLSFLAGVWIAKGMPGSPWVFSRRGGELPTDPYKD
jgi:hypothetical protein